MNKIKLSKKNKEEIIFWYEKIMEQSKSDLNHIEFCKQHGLNYSKFNNMFFRTFNCFNKKPDEYRKRLLLLDDYNARECTRLEFCKQNDFTIGSLQALSSHMTYKKVIEEYLYKKEGKEVKFLEVPNNASVSCGVFSKKLPPQQIEVQHEVIEKQNDIEIIINKGIKVTLSPNIESMKIIKIIELLKDL